MFFLESAEIGIGKEKLFDILCELLEKNNIVYNKDELELAYQEACAAYVGVTRYSGEEYVTHIECCNYISTAGSRYKFYNCWNVL